jgi:hypothetical protein
LGSLPGGRRRPFRIEADDSQLRSR